ncbi:hypothetical protein [Bacillus cereus group sp. BfR-BA-02730]|uniref:hypothetical protein n=2 Tax=unclassified Bacillus cereus group TaxID=2750818 RepID=UPI0029C57FEF|nr:hypothetical protein [Bacillus cereus group sp. BfR-BA-02730]MDX5808473.1 hypothetical protein [Bacillus cereus group sp. BfR-BA-02730]
MILLKDLQFVTTNGTDVGIIFDYYKDTHVTLIHENSNSDSPFLDVKDIDVRPMTVDEIKKGLERIKQNFEQYAYFIVQLNDINELDEYHIEENEFVQQVRIESTCFAEDFDTDRNEYQQHNGKPFTALKMLKNAVECEERLYKIKFSTGEEIDVYGYEVLAF